jgi:hypothetical protein
MVLAESAWCVLVTYGLDKPEEVEEEGGQDL